jgi:hypothetical protein
VQEVSRRDEELKRAHERATGHRFIQAYNRRRSTRFAFREQRKPPAPDLVYATTRGRLVGVEVVTAYYDERDATTRWGPARGHHGGGWAGVDPDENLAAFINRVLADKCAKRYDVSGPCMLVVDARPPLTDERDIKRTVLPAIRVPTVVPYSEIYLGVDLPISLGNPSAHEGQYRIWQLYPSGRRGGAPVPGSGFPAPDESDD